MFTHFLIRLSVIVCGLALVVADVEAAQERPYGLDTRPKVEPFLNHKMPEAVPLVSGDWVTVPVFTNLLFTNALGLTFVPGTATLAVWEREGRIYSFDNSPGVASKKLILDISPQCQGWDDSGLLGIAFHPGFATNHYLFLYYTWVKPGTVQGNPDTRPPMYIPGAYHDRLERYTLDPSGVADPKSVVVLVDQIGNSVWHNGGGMFFHPDTGFLYVTDGDDENGDNTQRIDRDLFSGVWRLDVDMRGGVVSHPIPRQPAHGKTANYYIPNDNPFVGQPNVLEEFFAIGLRSPHRMTIDPVTTRIFIGDVGDVTREEVDNIEPTDPGGLNFQWDRIEGLHGDLKPPYIGVNRRPLIDYGHDEGQAVIGGYVYRGTEFASELGGRYIFGDNVQKKIWMLDETVSPPRKILLAIMPTGAGPNSGSDYTGLSSFGEDQNRELYLCQMSSVGGHIYKLAHSDRPPVVQPFPRLLSETGVFKDIKNLAPADWLVPYSVNSPLWSDGAMKQRWLALATNLKIHFLPTGDWEFPNGTVFVKNFQLATNVEKPDLLRRLETRFLVRDTNGGAYGVTYKWKSDGSDAELLPDGADEDITVQTASGPASRRWHYPSRLECLRCHNSPAGYVLGVKTRQLNGDFTYPSTAKTDNQIRAWNHAGLLDPPVDESKIAQFDKLVTVNNTNAPLETRVRSYLDANCSQCHRPGSGTFAFWDARSDTPSAQQKIINGQIASPSGIANAKVVAPHDPQHSMLYLRMSAVGPGQMPPLARNILDTNALQTVSDWINQLR
jgi:uncharacterized repeat protein (TIGR03806 family)